ncbi:hypothetical protein [Ruegeria atlantica]|uniref:hypothetical protein n=1 Tax=Ruegeria atlantica TaxID=81569 RepID=UPI00147A88A8|nr:hypothetical protein [Ruegeria atlantica]
MVLPVGKNAKRSLGFLVVLSLVLSTAGMGFLMANFETLVLPMLEETRSAVGPENIGNPEGRE